jgi:glycosyltransferase involved in cell wall biosynthesis
VVVVYFGFINEGKGFDDLLRALAICRDRGLGFRLVCIADLCAKEDAYHAQMWALAEELGLRGKIVFTGYLQPEQVAEHLGAADIAVLPFNYGASTKRSSLLAALSCGLPVITTGDHSLPSFFADGQNILLVPVRDPKALAEAIRKLAGDRALRLRLRRGAVQLSRHFSWSDIARQHRHLYRGLSNTGVVPQRPE